MLKPVSLVVALLMIVLLVTAAVSPSCARQPAQSSDKHVHLKNAKSLDTKVSEVNSLFTKWTAQWEKNVNDARMRNKEKNELYKNLKSGDDLLEDGLILYSYYASKYNELEKAIDANEISSGDVPSVKKSLKSTASNLAEINDMLREHQTKVSEYRQWLRDEFE